MKVLSTLRRTTVLSLVAAAGCCLSPLSALARQPGATAPSPTLKGPEVKDRNVPGVSPDFGISVDGKRRFADRMPPEVFRKALAVLTAPDAPADIRATDAQREAIRTSVEGFEQQVREYRKSHAAEITQLRQAAGEIQAAGKGGAKAAKLNQDEMTGPSDAKQELSAAELKQREEAKAKLRELMEGAPRVETVYTQVWTSLSEPQQKAVDAKLAEYKSEQAKKREDAYVQKRAASKKTPAVDGSPTKPSDVRPSSPAAEMSKLTPELRERLIRFFEQLSPEERAQLMSRLEERLKDRAPAAKGEPGKARKQGKPAPNPDEVKVPAPTQKN